MYTCHKKLSEREGIGGNFKEKHNHISNEGEKGDDLEA